MLALLLDSLHEQLNLALSHQKSWDLDNSSPAETMMSSILPPENQSGPSTKQELNNASQSACRSNAELNNASLRAEHSSQSQSDSRVSDPADQSQRAKVDIHDFHDIPLTNNQAEVVQSEDSNQSESSLHSTDLVQSEMLSQRLEAIPETVKPFNSPENPAESVSQAIAMDTDATEPSGATKSCMLPSLEDLYMKDTKTLNTNVLATEYLDDDVATDSDKFHKPDNLTRSPQQASDLFENFEQLNDLLSYEATKDASLKPVKETNLLANMKEKFSDDCYTEKCLFSEMVGAVGCVSREGIQNIQKKLLFSQLDTDDTSCSINNIKRMKIDEDEKNLRMQAKLKVNTDKNPSNICSNLTLRTSQISDQACAMVVDGDQSLSQSVTSFPREHPVIPLPNQLREKDYKEAERSWKRYISNNRSVVVDTFQGQFKSTVSALKF